MTEDEVARLYRDYGYAIFRRCLVYLGDPIGAQDAVQDVFVRALVAAAGFRGESNPRTWLCRIADHLCVPSKLPDDPTQWSGSADPLTLGYARFERRFAEQQVEVATQFPAQFTLNLSAPPPRQALATPLANYFEPRVMADGQLVVYRDANANGVLDLSTFAEPSTDEVLSVSAGPSLPALDRQHSIQYIEREPLFDDAAARADGFLGDASYVHQYDYLEPGYNLVAVNAAGTSFKRLPEDEPISLRLDANPWSRQALCQEYCQKPDDYECPADPADLPRTDKRSEYESDDTAGNSWHFTDGTRFVQGGESCSIGPSGVPAYEYWRLDCDGCVCESLRCNYEHHELPQAVEDLASCRQWLRE